MTLIEDVAPFLFDIKDPELLHVLVFQLLKLIGFDFSQPLKVGRADNGDAQPQLDCYGGAGPAAASLLMDGIIRAINANSKVTSAARPAAGLAFNIAGSLGASMSAFAQDEAVSDSGDVQSLCGVSAISRPLGTSLHLPWIRQRRQPQEAVDVEQDGSSGDDVLAPSGRVDISPSLNELTVWNFAQNVLHCALLVFSHSSAVKAAAISLSAQRPATLIPVGTQGKPDDGRCLLPFGPVSKPTLHHLRANCDYLQPIRYLTSWPSNFSRCSQTIYGCGTSTRGWNSFSTRLKR